MPIDYPLAVPRKACGMTCGAYRRVLSKYDPKIVSDLDLKIYTDLKELLLESDVVVCTLPGTPATKNIFSRKMFSLMKTNAIFINCGRGSCIDEGALYDELSSGRLFAALDVYNIEPLPSSSRMWDLPGDRFLHTPHNADLTNDVFSLGWSVFLQNLSSFKENKPFVTLVDKKVGY